MGAGLLSTDYKSGAILSLFKQGLEATAGKPLSEEERKRVIADGMTYVDELEVQSSKALKERREKTDAETQKRLRTERAKINKHLRDIALGRSSGRGVGR